MELPRVLVIDDEKAVLNFLYVLLTQSEKYDPDILNDSSRAYEILTGGGYDLLLLDMDMPRVTGLDILKFIREKEIDIETIVLTGVDDVELAVNAMKLGAYDYLRKPVDNDLLLLNMDRAMERKNMRKEIVRLKQEGGWEFLTHKTVFQEIVTRNSKMLRIFHLIEKIAPTDTSVLIWGESGTGKELIARAIHRISNRSNKPFVAVNAGVFARELFASEFFGHTRGAFSGADSDKKGFLEESHGGTLFMDEIGELPVDIQVKLLRVLQDGKFFRVGSTREREADVRIIAATNKNLQEEIEKGSFRTDLFYRLNVNSITLPPLRERQDDISLLTKYFIDFYNKKHNKNIRGVSPAVGEILESYHYPGNIRELKNIIESAVLVENHDKLTIHSLPQYFQDQEGKADSGEDESASLDEDLSLEEIEKLYIKKILQKTGGNRTQTAKILKISRVTLISKLKKYGLSDIQLSD